MIESYCNPRPHTHTQSIIVSNLSHEGRETWCFDAFKSKTEWDWKREQKSLLEKVESKKELYSIWRIHLSLSFFLFFSLSFIHVLYCHLLYQIDRWIDFKIQFITVKVTHLVLFLSTFVLTKNILRYYLSRALTLNSANLFCQNSMGAVWSDLNRSAGRQTLVHGNMWHHIFPHFKRVKRASAKTQIHWVQL